MKKKILTIIKENLYFIILSITIILSFYIELPYYIETSGGLIDTDKRIEINTKYETYGSINMTYVSQIKATPFSFLLAKIRNYDIEKKEEVINENETEEDIYFRSRMLLDDVNNNATIYAYKKAGKNVEIINSECYVVYIDKEADTDLKLKDRIININGYPINERNDIDKVLKTLKKGDKIIIDVINEKIKYTRYAYLLEYENNPKIGIMVSEKKEITTNPEIKFKFKTSESGPSGGLMMALAIYNKLTEKDITNGLKISGTGSIDSNGVVGSISGVKHKLKGAIKEKADIFFVPNGENYEEAVKIQTENNYDIEIIGVSNFDDVINYLE